MHAEILKAIGVERFDVADTMETLKAAIAVMEDCGMKRENAITITAGIYRTAQREITTKPS